MGRVPKNLIYGGIIHMIVVLLRFRINKVQLFEWFRLELYVPRSEDQMTFEKSSRAFFWK